MLVAKGDGERALELVAMVLHHPMSCQWAKDRAVPLIVELEADLPPEAVTAARERGRARDLDATVVELLEELGGA